MNDDPSTILQGCLEQGLTGDTEARQRLLELSRDRLMRHARRYLYGRHGRSAPKTTTPVLNHFRRPASLAIPS